MSYDRSREVRVFLKILTVTLMSPVTSLVRNERRPFEEKEEEEEAASDTPSSRGSSVPQHEHEDEDDNAEDSPWDMSSESGNERGSGSEQANAYGTFVTRTRRTTIRLIDLRQPTTTEMRRLLNSVKFTVASLYRLPMREPAPLDRLHPPFKRDISLYHYFDTLHVRDKYPNLDLKVASRLGKLITRRRQLLWSREEHHEKLRTRQVDPQDTRQPAASEGPVLNQKENIEQPQGIHRTKKSHTMRSHTVPGQSQCNHLSLPTKATTFRVGDLQKIFKYPNLNSPSDVESQSSVETTFTENGLSVNIPSRPKDNTGVERKHFECPYCFTIQNIWTKRRWK